MLENSGTLSTGRKLALGSGLRVLLLAGTAIVSFFLMPFVVHSLGDRMYGIWTLVATFIGYYGLLDLGFSSAVTRYLAAGIGAGDHEDCNRVFNTSLVLFSLLAVAVLLVTAVLAAAAPVLSRTAADADLFRKLILILGLNLAVAFPFRAIIGTLNAALRYDITAGLELLTLLIRSALIVAVLLAGHKILGMAWATLVAGIPSMLLYLRLTRRALPFLRLEKQYWGRHTAHRLFSYSAYTFIGQVADLLRFQVDNLVVAGFVSVAMVTHYSIAGTLVAYFINLMTAATGVFSSVFSRQSGANDQEGLQRTLLFATKLSVCMSTFIAFGLIAWGKPFIARWMGTPYLDAYPPLLVLTLGAMLALWQSPSVGLLYGISRHKFFALFNSLEGVANLILSLVLVRSYGLVGVALGTFVPMAITKIFIQPAYVCRVGGIPYRKYMLELGRTVGLLAISLIAPAVLSAYYVRPEYTSLVAIGAASLVLYCIPVLMFEFTPSETRVLQDSLLPRLAARRSAT